MRTWSLLPAVKSSRQHRRSLSSCSNQLVAQKELGENLPVSDDYLFPPSLSKLYRHFCKDHSELAGRAHSAGADAMMHAKLYIELAARGAPL